MLHFCHIFWVKFASFSNKSSKFNGKPILHFAPYLLSAIALPFVAACTQMPFTSEEAQSSEAVQPSPTSLPTKPTAITLPPETTGTPHEVLIAESWSAYRQRFIQDDGRVIDWESNARTVSEGQAYAMLRAVLMDDPDVFERTLAWAEDNLRRPPLLNDADGVDSLWAWKWGERPDGSWGIQDPNFASDADIDAITALILAKQRWNRPDYGQLAQEKLDDLWDQSVFTLPPSLSSSFQHYLLPGPQPAFQPEPNKIYLNPSYLAPYAFKLFAQVDTNPEHDWLALVDSSYDVLEQTQALSEQGLPADWVLLDWPTQAIQSIPNGAPLQSRYSFDAYRVWWRVAWDLAWYDEPRAYQFLENHLFFLAELWQESGQIPAVMTLSGDALADYESTSQYGMLYLAFQQIYPDLAEEVLDRKIITTYDRGIWDDADAYYVQNLAWLGLFPPDINQLIPIE